MSVRSARLARFFVSVVAGLALLPALSAAMEMLDPRGRFGLLSFYAVCFGEFWIATLIHELGHALAARVIGWQVHAIAVKPFMYRPNKGFSSARGQGTSDIGGFVFATPGSSGDWSRGVAVFALGGVLANVASSVVVIVVVAGQLFGRGPYPLLASFAFVSLVVAAVNLVPIRGPGLRRSDGAMFIDAVRGRRYPPRERFASLAAQHFEGVDPMDWDAGLFDQVERDAETDPALSSASAPLLFMRYYGRGDFARARAVLAPIVSPYPDVQPWTQCAKAFFCAHVDHNGTAAQELLAKLRPAARREPLYWLALAATHDALGDRDGARAAAERMRAVAAKRKMKLDRQDMALLDGIERS